MKKIILMMAVAIPTISFAEPQAYKCDYLRTPGVKEFLDSSLAESRLRGARSFSFKLSHLL